MYIFFFFIFNLNFEGTGYSSMATCFATNSLHFVLKLIVVVFTVFFLYRFPSFDRKQHLRNCGKKNPQKDKLLSTLSVTLGFSLIFFVTRLSPWGYNGADNYKTKTIQERTVAIDDRTGIELLLKTTKIRKLVLMSILV